MYPLQFASLFLYLHKNQYPSVLKKKNVALVKKKDCICAQGLGKDVKIKLD